MPSGSIHFGGGIYNGGTLTVANSVIDGNAVATSLGGLDGGAIFNAAALTVENSTISDNLATNDGGGIFNAGTASLLNSTVSDNSAGFEEGGGSGGGVYNQGTLTIVNSTISDNRATGTFGNVFGGGIANAGMATIDDTAISGNSAPGFLGNGSGGGIDNTGTMMVTDASISANSAGGRGQAIGGGIENSGTLTIGATTISGNSVIAGLGSAIGGGIDNDGSLALVNATVSGNEANTGGDGISNAGKAVLEFVTISDNQTSGSGLNDAVDNVTSPSTAFAAIDSIFNSPGGVSISSGAGGEFQSLGHNIFSDRPDLATNSTDLVDTDPMLGPLSNNGGPTMTQALLATSPAINAGVAIPGVSADQRGVYRPQGAAPDIGAFEAQLPPVVLGVRRYGVHSQPTTLVVTFSHPMNAGSVEDLANYRLVPARPHTRSSTGDGRVIRIRFARYDADSLTATLRPMRRLPLHKTFQLTIVGTPPAGLTDTAGLYLGGAHSGQQGSNFVTLISDRLLVSPIPHARTRASRRVIGQVSVTARGRGGEGRHPLFGGKMENTGGARRRSL